MKINQYIQSLTKLSDNINNEIKTIVIKNEGHFLKTIKLRLYNYGIDANGNSLGIYLPFTKKRKLEKGQRSSHVTLRDSGDWYASMFIDFREGAIWVDASDYKTPMLEDIYGDAILGLSEQETELFVDSILEPELQKIIDGFGDLE